MPLQHFPTRPIPIVGSLRLATTLSSLVLVASLFTGCQSDRNPPAVSSDAASPTSPVSPTGTASPAPESSHANTLTADGLGTVKVGMGLADINPVLGAPLTALDDQPLPDTIASERCYFGKSANLAGAEFMLSQGTLVRIDVLPGSAIKTAAGVGIGDPQSAVETAYPGQVASMPHKYVQNGQYLIVTPAGGGEARIVFETDGQQVTAIRAGRTPEVEWVERCG